MPRTVTWKFKSNYYFNTIKHFVKLAESDFYCYCPLWRKYTEQILEINWYKLNLWTLLKCRKELFFVWRSCKIQKRPFLLRGSASDIIGRVYDAFQTLRGGGKVWHLIFEKRCPLSAYQDQFSAFNTWSSFVKIQASLHMFLITATSCATCLWNVKNYIESFEWCQIRAILRRPTAGRLRSVTSLAGGSQGGTLAAAAAGWYAGMLEKGGGGSWWREERWGGSSGIALALNEVYWLQRSVQALHRMLHVTNPYRYDRSDVDSCNICFEIFATSGLLVVRKYMKFACLPGLCFRLHLCRRFLICPTTL